MHHPLGASTGYMADAREDWAALVRRACEVSTFAVELRALGERELPGLLAFLAGRPRLPFHYLSVHAPTKGLRLPERELVAVLASLPPHVDAVVVHPDKLVDPAAWRPLGHRLVLENMDGRKPVGQRPEQLGALFAALPEAGLCLDVAHAAAVDPTMALGHALLDAHGGRLRQLHVSSLRRDRGSHVPLTRRDEARFCTRAAPLPGRPVDPRGAAAVALTPLDRLAGAPASPSRRCWPRACAPTSGSPPRGRRSATSRSTGTPRWRSWDRGDGGSSRAAATRTGSSCTAGSRAPSCGRRSTTSPARWGPRRGRRGSSTGPWRWRRSCASASTPTTTRTRPGACSSCSRACRCWARRAHREAQRAILAAYLEGERRDRRPPRFLLNDVVRYWRTICVDFEGKARQGSRKWALRHAKLRTSRTMLFAGGLLPVLACHHLVADEVEPFLLQALAEPPTDRVARAFLEHDAADAGGRTLGAYDRFLALIDDPERRGRLEALDRDAAPADPVFQEARRLGREVQQGLLALLFEREPLRRLVRQYLVV